MVLPYILHPTRITGHSKTLIDNIFSNHMSKKAICGNLTYTISDHLPQFLIIPSIFSDPSSLKSNVYERSWSNFNKEEFILDYFEKDWDLITAAIHKSILVKNYLFKKYIKLKDPVKKTQTHDKYKYYRNLLSTVIKKSTQNYNEFFKTNMNNI